MTSLSEDMQHVDTEEAIKLGAVDGEFFTRTFFPQTARQPSPAFHRRIDQLLDSTHRQVNILAFRGSAKTTKCRIFTIKRICYGLSNTVLYIGKSEAHAIRSVSWIKKQVEYNSYMRDVFGLRPGEKWQDVEAEIKQPHTGHNAWVMAAGIGGSIRGVNRDDYRPDLIVLDDVLDDENCQTEEQREKISNLIYGAVLESLTPETENPLAKIVSLNTPQHKEDYAVAALSSPAWASEVFGCWTPETANKRPHEQESIWEERFPTDTLRKEKQMAISTNRLSVFLREKELKLVSPEKASFKLPWIKKYRTEPPQDNMLTAIAVDPVPPPSDVQLKKGLTTKDDEAQVVVGRRGANYFLLDYKLSRGHNPDWSVTTLFTLYRRWQPFRVRVESVAYQSALAWFIEQEMIRQKFHFAIEQYKDKRKKFARITSLGPIAAAGRLWVHESHLEFLEQFATYPDVERDDLLDAVSMAVNALEELGPDTSDIVNADVSMEGFKPMRICSAP
jgi:phage terminase large subunit-like protein